MLSAALVVASAAAAPVPSAWGGPVGPDPAPVAGGNGGGDADARSDLIAYAFGTDPALGEAAVPVLAIEEDPPDEPGGGAIRFSLLRRRDRESLVYLPEFSDDLREWFDLPVRVESVEPVGVGFERVRCRVAAGVGGRRPARFVRLRVDRVLVGGRFGSEAEARAAFEAASIGLAGRVIDAAGEPIAGATVTVDPDMITNGGELVTVTDGAGGFEFEVLDRRNVVLEVRADGCRPEAVPVQLHRPLAEVRCELAPLRLDAVDPGVVRFLFAGDTALGRRFINPGATAEPGDPDRSLLPVDHPEALLRVSDPLPGALGCVAFVRPLFGTGDFPVVNLESPVLREPATPHPTKGYAFFTLPEALGALSGLGVRYVTLGNNHVFDYLESGVRETLAHVTAAGIGHSGLGIDADEAFRVFEAELHGTRFAFFSACSVGGEHTPPGNLAAEAKGGAADLRDSARVRAAIGSAAAGGAVMVAQLHTGKEYSRTPSPYARDRMRLAVEAGADLVIAHHTHVAQGFELIDGVLVAHCLGNFLFDQQRAETLLGLVARVDMDGASAVGAAAHPVYLEDFRPRMVAGRLADRFLRRIADVSSVPIVIGHGRGRLVLGPDEAAEERRELEIPIEVGPDGWAIVDLRRWLDPDESVAAVSAPGAGLRVRFGRDLLVFGGMEDCDVDGESADGEASRWWRAGGAYRGLNHPFAGAVALYSAGTRRLPDLVVGLSVTADGVRLADGGSFVNQAEVVSFDPARADAASDGELPGAGAGAFGGDRFFERLGNPPGEREDIDAVFLHDDGRISFSTASDFASRHLGVVRDGSVVTYDPSRSVDDPSSLVLLVDEDALFPEIDGPDANNQDIDALHVDATGRVCFSTRADARVRGPGGALVEIRNGDVARWDPASGEVDILLREDELFTEDADIDAFSMTPAGVPVFSVASTVGLAGSGERLVDGAVGRFDAEAGGASILLLQSDLFEDADGAGALADLDALHVAPSAGPLPSPDPPPVQIAFRHRIRVEGDAENTPNKDVTALGYLWLENNGPMALNATFHASFGERGPESFGGQTIVEDGGGGTAAWRFFARDLELPADDPDASWPEAENARAIRLFLHHQAPLVGHGLVGLDELAVVSWEVDGSGSAVMESLDSPLVVATPHDRDFLRIEGPAGLYRIRVTACRTVSR